jgi:hypothetical protein
MVKAVRDLGLRRAGINVISTQHLVPDKELPNMGEVGVGLVTSRRRPADQQGIHRCTEQGICRQGDTGLPVCRRLGRHGNDLRPDQADQGKFAGDKAMNFFSTWKTEDRPRGPIAIDPASLSKKAVVELNRSHS